MREKEFCNEHGEYIVDDKNMIHLDRVLAYHSATQFIGEEDASREWNQNPAQAQHMFLHTDAYKEFLHDNSLILLGRTGSGKTAILRFMEYMYKNEKGGNTIPIFLDFQEILLKISSWDEMFTTEPVFLTPMIEYVIRTYLNIIAMQKICFGDDVDKEKYRAEISKIKSYLNNNDISASSDSILQKISNITSAIDTEIKEIDKVAKSIGSLSKIIRQFKTPAYKEAHDGLVHILQTTAKKVVILIDSFQEYDMKRKEIVLVVKGLIDTCFSFYNYPNNNIIVKITLPSEIYKKVLIRLPGKEQGNAVSIKWTFKELIVCIALRLYFSYTLNKLPPPFNFCMAYKAEDFYIDGDDRAYENSINLLHNILPRICETSISCNFDTLAYCIRHTLKKPREALLMFNSFIQKIVDNDDIQFFLKNTTEVRNIVHSTQDRMIGSALSMYAHTYNAIYASCMVVLSNMPFVFYGKNITSKLQQGVRVSKNVKGLNDVNSEMSDNKELMQIDLSELTAVLMESGIIGEVLKTNIVQKNMPSFNNSEKVCIIVGDFEYKTESLMNEYVFIDDRQYVVHPMCYETFSCYVDRDTFVYPKSSDEDWDFVMKTIVNRDF
jgi:hypothetical protein